MSQKLFVLTSLDMHTEPTCLCFPNVMLFQLQRYLQISISILREKLSF